MKLQLILSTALVVVLLGSQCTAKNTDTPFLKLVKCRQSSISPTHPDAVCNKAIDGNRNQDLISGHSCSHTTGPGWWRAETEKLALFDVVEIYNRRKNENSLTDFILTVDDAVCYTLGPQHSRRRFSARPITCFQIGYVLRIETRQSDLTLCEVRVYGFYLNVDHIKLVRCRQRLTKSFHPDDVCNRAIDGNTNKDPFSDHSCYHTFESGWWKAETEKPAMIHYVQIYRWNKFKGSLTDFEISVENRLCYRHDGTYFSARVFNCHKKGSALEIATSKSFLSLCEVKVLGTFLEVENLKLSKCRQSSSYSPLFTCDKAIDGNFDSLAVYMKCARVGHGASGWWMAETDRLAHFENVEINNKIYCCRDHLKDFSILVNGVECNAYKSDVIFSTKTFPCSRKGRSVSIFSNKPYLTLCEVIATGAYLE